MKRLGLIAVIFSLLLGCASMYGRMGIATTEYVDQQHDEIVNDTEALYQELTTLQEEMKAIRQMAARIDESATTMEEVKTALTELQFLAQMVEGRIDNLSGETLKILRDLLSGYLEED